MIFTRNRSGIEKKVIVIGAGISGLTAGIYARKAGFETEIYESHSVAGGMCTGWRRKGYTIDGCVHWITGSKKGSDLYDIWETCGVLGENTDVINHEYISSIRYKDRFRYVYSDLDKLEKELLSLSPDEEDSITELVRIVRVYRKLSIPARKPQELLSLCEKLEFYIPYLKAGKILYKTSKYSVGEYISRFRSPAVRNLLASVIPNMKLTANTLFFTLATFSSHDGGWPIGGSFAMAQRMAEKFLSLGGKIYLNTPVNKVVIENGKAMGIELYDNSSVDADYIIPAVSADVLLNRLLGKKYYDSYFNERFSNKQAYQLLSATLISLGVDADIKEYPHSFYMELKHPLAINKTKISTCSMYHYCFEPSLSPRGKSLIEVALDDPEFKYWHKLKVSSEDEYKQVKEKLANRVICEIEAIYPELYGKIEILDVATPLTFHRYTAAYQGSYMSFCMTPTSKFQSHNGRITGIKNMYIAGQWSLPQGGLPIAAIAGKFAVQRICNQEKIKLKCGGFRTADILKRLTGTTPGEGKFPTRQE